MPLLKTRDDKLNWLLRPFDWALRLGLVVLCLSGLAGYRGDISGDTFAAVSGITLACVAGLLVWGVRRVTLAAQRRA